MHIFDFGIQQERKLTELKGPYEVPALYPCISYTLHKRFKWQFLLMALNDTFFPLYTFIKAFYLKCERCVKKLFNYYSQPLKWLHLSYKPADADREWK